MSLLLNLLSYDTRRKRIMKYLKIDKPSSWKKWFLRVLFVYANYVLATFFLEPQEFWPIVVLGVSFTWLNFTWGRFEMRFNWKARRQIKYEAIREYLEKKNLTNKLIWNDRYSSIYDIDNIMIEIIKKL